MADCNHELYLTRTEHDDHCDGVRLWTDVARAASEDDRKKLWTEVGLLRAFKEKVQWALLGGLCLTVISIWAAPYLTRNGEAKVVMEMNQKLNMTMDRVSNMATIINDIRADQERREAREHK